MKRLPQNTPTTNEHGWSEWSTEASQTRKKDRYINLSRNNTCHPVNTPLRNHTSPYSFYYLDIKNASKPATNIIWNHLELLWLWTNCVVLHSGLLATWGVPVRLSSTFDQNRMAKQSSSQQNFSDAAFQRVCTNEPTLATACTCCSHWKRPFQSKLRTWEWSAWPRRYSLRKYFFWSVLQIWGWSKKLKTCNCRKPQRQSHWQTQESSDLSGSCSPGRHGPRFLWESWG